MHKLCQFPCFQIFSSLYIRRMSGIFLALMGIAMLATLGALAMGLYAMTRGGEFNEKYGNKLMQARVVLQATAIVLFALAAWMGKGN